jgi:hypothetical protein
MTHPLLLLLETITASWGERPTSQPDGNATARPHEDRSALDLAALLLSLFEESQRINEILFRLMVAPLVEHTVRDHEPARKRGGAAPHQDALAAILVQARRWVVQYPVLAQAVYAALVAEGRRYGRTREGARWAQALNRSQTVRSSRPLFEAVTTNMSEDAQNPVLPNTLLQAVRELGSTTQLESWLSHLRYGHQSEET